MKPLLYLRTSVVQTLKKQCHVRISNWAEKVLFGNNSVIGHKNCEDTKNRVIVALQL